MDTYNYLDELNTQQREAVEYCDGPSLVIAGAGSGKTRVLTYKIVHLLRRGIEPYRLLALTFTNKAAREMKSRVSQVVGEKAAARIWMGTFHSIFLRILRKHADEIGYKNGFTIYDANDSKSLIKHIIKELGLDDKTYKASTVAAIISNAKNEMTNPEQYKAEYYDRDRKAKRPLIYRIYEMYSQRCRVANAMDFDDILFNMNLLLNNHPDIRCHYQEFFRYILVDEYQDTNFAQHLVVSQLAHQANKICVVGDDAQSIYSFRGANIGNIINLERVYPGLKTFKLERNYRSTQNIVNAAGSLIEKNSHQIKKNVYSENSKGSPVEIIQSYSDIEEAYIVAAGINGKKLSLHDSYEDYAILYRTNAQSRVLEEALRKRNIGYRIVGGTAFYQRKEVKDVISYFRVAVNPDDDEALRRIINYPSRGIGETTIKKIQSAATQSNVSLWQIIDNPQKYSTGVNSGTQKKLDNFAALIRSFISDNEKSDAYSLGQLIYNRTGILLLYASDSTPESISRHENLEELLNGLKDFVDIHTESGEGEVSMASFLSEVSLATDADEKDKTDEPKVTLMTAHAAKGLEFKHVYIVGAEEELFPAAMSMNSIAEVEEERRLMYVAITRAKETCTITYAKSRFRNGQTKLSVPSRFLSEIDRKYIQTGDGIKSLENDAINRTHFVNPFNNYQSSWQRMQKPTQRNKIGVTTVQGDSSMIQHNASEIRIGARIEHSKFGKGEVIKTGNISGEPSITVDFGATGVKNLLLKYARFKIID